MIKTVTGDLFEAKEKYLCHQTNCITQRSAHLSKDVFDRYPYADIYTGRITPDVPGTIVIRGNGNDQRYVVNLLGQYYPGKPKYPNSTLDGSYVRWNYFYKCLLQLAKMPDLESLAFPYLIGCGSAGGDWKIYLKILTKFADVIEKNQKADVVIYRREND